jgi:hypothetical protein
MRKYILLSVAIFAITCSTYSQSADNVLQGFLNQKESNIIETSNQTKNFKSIVSDLMLFGKRNYQALIKNGILKQNEGEIQVKSSLYGLGRIFDSSWSEDRNFRKLRWARNLQFGIGAVLGEENKIRAFNSSFTLALLNKRELKRDFFLGTAITPDALSEAVENIAKAFDKSINPNLEKADIIKFKKQIDDFTNTLDFDKLKGLLTDEEITKTKKKWEMLSKPYDSLQKKLSAAPLLTYSYEGNYGDKKWSKLNNKMEFIVGFGNKKDSVRKYDFYSGLFYEMTQDTLNKIGTLNRKVFSAKVGINAVLLKAKSDGSSIIEAFGGAEYQNINKGFYQDEKKEGLKVDLTLSFKIAPNLYLPFQVKYNATTGRFEGYLDLKFDVVNIFK